LLAAPEMRLPAYTASTCDRRLSDIQTIRRLTSELDRHCKDALVRSQIDDVLESSIGLFDLGCILCRDGLITDMLVWVAIVDLAVNNVRVIRDRLTASQMQTLLQTTSRFEKESDPIGAILERDEQWTETNNEEWDDDDSDDAADHSLNMSGSFFTKAEKFIAKMIASIKRRPGLNRHHLHRTLYDRSLTIIRLLQTDLALRLYRKTNASYPNELSDLVPAILPLIPVDPFALQRFPYRRHGAESFLLYSVGPGLVDHGGRFGKWTEILNGHADFSLDFWDYQQTDPVQLA